MKLNPIILLLIILWQSERVCRGEILVQPTDTWVVESHNATLYCEFSLEASVTSSSRKCSWTKGGTLIAVDQFQGVYEWLGDYQMGNCSLIIHKALLERDENIWKCQLPETETSEGEVSRTAKVTVYVEPSVPLLYEKDEMTSLIKETLSIWENETSTVNCVTHHANPVASMSWELDGTGIPSSQDYTSHDDVRAATSKRVITLIRKFGKEDNGKLLGCRMKHETLNTTSVVTQTQLDVQYGTTQVEILSPNYVQVNVGSGYSFVCKADGNPTPKCEWLYKKKDQTDWTVVIDQCQYELEAANKENEGEYIDTTYMIPMPSELAPLRPPTLPPARSRSPTIVYRDKKPEMTNIKIKCNSIGNNSSSNQQSVSLVKIQVNGEDEEGNDVFLEDEKDSVMLTCKHDMGPPTETTIITWEVFSKRDNRWKIDCKNENIESIIVNVTLLGEYRCKVKIKSEFDGANNFAGANSVVSSNQIKVQRKEVEDGNFMIIIGIALGCLAAVIILLIVLVRIGWERQCKTKPSTEFSSSINATTNKNVSFTQSTDEGDYLTPITHHNVNRPMTSSELYNDVNVIHEEHVYASIEPKENHYMEILPSDRKSGPSGYRGPNTNSTIDNIYV
ncbi:hypothetical protein CHUAL_009000 [Chamberlinius hualienensis]